MKYLYTVAVVSSGLGARLSALLAENRSDRLLRVESILRRDLTRNGDAIAFYRSVMDGWDKTHRFLSPYIERDFPALRGFWKRFVRQDFAVIKPNDSAVLSCMAALSARQCRGIAQSKGYVGGYAALALLDTIKDAARFASATKCNAYLVSRLVGPSRNDAEYQDGRAFSRRAVPQRPIR
jgi:hypothetical protein